MQIITIIIQLYIIIALGYGVEKIFKADNKILTYLGIYVFAPTLLFYGVYIGDYSWNILIIPGVYLLLNFLMLGLGYVYSKIFKYSFEDQSIITFLAFAGNNGNFGIPVILLLLGEEALAMISLLILVNSIFIMGPGVYFMGREKNAFKKSVVKVMKMPLLYAVVIGLFCNLSNINIPDFFLKPMKIVGEALVPVQLILLGTFLAQVKLIKVDWKMIAPSLILKLIVMPALAYILVRIFSLPLERDVYVMLIEAATPLAVMSVGLADLYKRKPQQISIANFLSLLLVPLTLTIFWWLINL